MAELFREQKQDSGTAPRICENSLISKKQFSSLRRATQLRRPWSKEIRKNKLTWYGCYQQCETESHETKPAITIPHSTAAEVLWLAMSCLRTCVRKFARKYHINIKMPDSINIRTLSVIYLSVAVTMFTLTKVSIFLACSVRRECYGTERLLLRSVPVRHEGVPLGPNLTLILNCD